MTGMMHGVNPSVPTEHPRPKGSRAGLVARTLRSSVAREMSAERPFLTLMNEQGKRGVEMADAILFLRSTGAHPVPASYDHSRRLRQASLDA